MIKCPVFMQNWDSPPTSGGGSFMGLSGRPGSSIIMRQSTGQNEEARSKGQSSVITVLGKLKFQELWSWRSGPVIWRFPTWGAQRTPVPILLKGKPELRLGERKACSEFAPVPLMPGAPCTWTFACREPSVDLSTCPTVQTWGLETTIAHSKYEVF